ILWHLDYFEALGQAHDKMFRSGARQNDRGRLLDIANVKVLLATYTSQVANTIIEWMVNLGLYPLLVEQSDRTAETGARIHHPMVRFGHTGEISPSIREF